MNHKSTISTHKYKYRIYRIHKSTPCTEQHSKKKQQQKKTETKQNSVYKQKYRNQKQKHNIKLFKKRTYDLWFYTFT